ncbi:MAG: HEAT repeat domain-containing protein [Candidatus Fervidibacter sp.]|uniref:HEAT repeat domain-containing protein n=1 Tax=Candidatus Fervidibacter sp. TaxID=3100871 RepID=UPI0040494313
MSEGEGTNIRDEHQTFTLTIPCGKGEHEVTITLTEQGKVKVFSPCQLLPESARRLVGSDCLDHFYKRLVWAILTSQDRQVSEVAVKILVAISEPAVKPLIEALKDWQFREAAIEALVEIGEPSVEQLIEASDDEDLSDKDFSGENF